MRVMHLRPHFLDENFVPLPPTQGLVFNVQQFSHQVLGGPELAHLDVSGSGEMVWPLLSMLAHGVEIRDQYGVEYWWGQVVEIGVMLGAIQIRLSLDGMANTIAVEYSYIESGSNVVGERQTTSWTVDADSVATWGTMEKLISSDGMSPAAAEQLRDVLIDQLKVPVAIAQQFGSYDTGDLSGTIICRGWFETLKWRYANTPVSALIRYDALASPAQEQSVGAASGNTKCAQQLVAVAGVDCAWAQVYIRKQGSPADNLVLELYEFENGAPKGSALGTVSMAGSGLGTSLAWVTFTFSSALKLERKTIFGIVLSRSGSNDASNYYSVGVNSALGYAYGAFRLWNGTAWVARSTDADMNFKLGVSNMTETTQQIKDLALEYGDYLNGVVLECSSGLTRSSYQRGDKTAYEVIVELLKNGTSNKRRMIAHVNIARKLYIREEPANTPVEHMLDRQGELRRYGQQINPACMPVGVWARLLDTLGGLNYSQAIGDPGLQFLEGYTWNLARGFQHRFRGQPRTEDILRVQE